MESGSFVQSVYLLCKCLINANLAEAYYLIMKIYEQYGSRVKKMIIDK